MWIRSNPPSTCFQCVSLESTVSTTASSRQCAQVPARAQEPRQLCHQLSVEGTYVKSSATPTTNSWAMVEVTCSPHLCWSVALAGQGTFGTQLPLDCIGPAIPIWTISRPAAQGPRWHPCLASPDPGSVLLLQSAGPITHLE